MRNQLILILLAVLFSPVLADTTYTHPSLGFSINHPQTWTVERQNFAAFLVTYPGKDILDKRSEHFRVEVVELSGNGGNSMIAEMDRRTLEGRFPDMKLGTSKAMALGKIKDGHMFEFVGKHEGRPFKLMRVLGFDGNRAYKITFLGTKYNYDKLQPKVKKMISSFKVKK